MNIETQIKDERGLEMVVGLFKLKPEHIIYTYQNLLEYVNRVGIDEAYNKYIISRDKLKWNYY